MNLCLTKRVVSLKEMLLRHIQQKKIPQYFVGCLLQNSLLW